MIITKEPRSILMTVWPQHAEKIWTGEKTVLLRRHPPKIAAMRLPIYIYETAPIQRVTGIIEDWSYYPCFQLTKDHEFSTCMTLDEMLKYSGGQTDSMGNPAMRAIGIESFTKLNTPRTISEFGFRQPPLNWWYIY